MKKVLSFALFFSFALMLQAQQWVNSGSPTPKPAHIQLVSSTPSSTTLQLNISGYNSRIIQTPQGNALSLSLEETTPMLSAGNPDLPKVTTSLIIPDNAKMEVLVNQSSWVDYPNVDIAPSKGNLTRDIDPATVPYTYGTSYNTNKFFPGKLAELKDPYILRDMRGQTVVLYPFQYNPVTKVLRVYTNLVVSVSSNGLSSSNVFNRTKAVTKIDPAFDNIYKHQFINYTNQYKYTALAETGKMLVICADAFMAAMQPFVNWKNTEGIPCTMVNVTTAGGTAAAIKTYVTNYYNTNGLTFLLLVGDAAQLPTFTVAGGGSDPTYGYLAGSDHYQEIFVGRFSAENEAQVVTQVQRSINYEKTPSLTAGKYNHAVGIASSQGTGDDNEYDYDHQRNLLTKMLAFTYTSRAELFDGNQGGVDASGDPTAAMLGTEINNGTGIITYTGHGGDDVFVTTGFSNTNAAALTNNAVLPFIWSVACVNGNFTAGTCLAEALMRQTYNSQPAGAVATLMSTINQSWSPPMDGQDEMVDILTETYPSNIKRTFGGLSVNGIFKMNDAYSDFNMTDTWTIFGDPSLMVRTDDPASMTVTHAPAVNVGTTSLTVNCNVNGALICLSVDHEIIGTGTVSGGAANITFPAVTIGDTITVCATAFNYVPYLGTVLVSNTSGPYVAYISNAIHDATGNNNSLADFGEAISLDVNLHNYGGAAANAVTATISSSDSYVNITDNTQSYGTIASAADALQSGAFAFGIANNIPDQHQIPFNIQIQDNSGNNWPASFNINVNAPDLSAGAFVVDDAAGNNNGSLDTSETVNIIINTANDGHADAPSTVGILSTTTPQYVTINSGNHNFGTLAAAGNSDATFSITAASDVPDSAVIELVYTLTSGAYSVNYHYFLTLGLVSEDFETGDFSLFDWTQGGDVPWIITGTGPYEGLYSAKSGVITDDQSSTLSLTLEALINDSISFWKKVSSEQDYDYLRFYIDGVQQGEWCGEVAWSQNAYPVSAGSHTYTWTYSKDYMVSAGSDCAWLDYIVFPPIVSSVQGVEENSAFSVFNCNPNPCLENTSLQFVTGNTGTYTISVLDMTGRVVKTVQGRTQAGELNLLNLDVSGFNKGVYFVTLKTATESGSLKLIKID
jgi:hypothetical protein